MSAPGITPGADAAHEDRKKRRGLLPILLGVVVLLIAGTALLSLGGDDGDDVASLPRATTQPENPTLGQSAGTAGEGGTLNAAGQSLFDAGVPADRVVGETATGTTVVVRDVVEGEGFFVGQTDDDRVYVELGGGAAEVGTAGGLPGRGDRVDLTGPVRPAPQDPAGTLGLSVEQATDVQQDGFYVSAESVTPR